MKNLKKIESVKIPEGKGAVVHRLFPNKKYYNHFDPFVLLDEFKVQKDALVFPNMNTEVLKP